MSTLATTNIKHPSSASNNIVLDSAGGVDLDALTVSGSAPADSVNIDASGRLLVGTSTAPAGSDAQYARIAIRGNTLNNNASILSLGNGQTTASTVDSTNLGIITFNDNDSTTGEYARITCSVDGNPGASDYPGRIVFSTTADGASSPTERMRITQRGAVATLGSASTDSFIVSSAAGAGTSLVFISGRHSGSAIFGGTESFRVYTNGNVQNTNNSYTAISDIKLKENIVDANSQWDDLKALRVRNYNLKEGQTHTQIGLVAQEVEPISPGLVYESPDRNAEGNDLGTVTKSVNYSVLYMKAVKALQEAMERIEQLEATNADLLARVTALESA
jgi:hypothetical protein